MTSSMFNLLGRMRESGMALISVIGFGIAGPIFAAQSSQTNLAVVVQHAPTLNGNGRIEGSLQQLSGEAAILNGGFVMTGDLLVPGTPTLKTNGRPVFAGTIAGNGSAAPGGYAITLNGNCSMGYLRTRTTPISLAAVAAPKPPAGTRDATLNSAGQSIGNTATLRNLTLNGNAGLAAVPPGTYGAFTANGASGFAFGQPGSAQPAIYNLQNLNLNGQSRLDILGPVILTIANGFSANGSLGSTNHPNWLDLRLAAGGCTLNGGCTVQAMVTAPAGTLIVNGNSCLVGSAQCDRLIVNGGGIIKAGVAPNRPPTAAPQTIVTLENTSTNILLAGSDPDGDTLAFQIVTPPSHGSVSGTPPALIYSPAPGYHGADFFLFKASDGNLDSLPAAVSILINHVNIPPAVALVSPVPQSEFAFGEPIPVAVSASDSDGAVVSSQILVDGIVLADFGSPPFNFIWTNASPGDHVLQAAATDDSGATSASHNVVISVIPPESGNFTVEAGLDQVILLPASAKLEGSIEIPDPTPALPTNFLWSKVAGLGNVEFLSAVQSRSAATFSQPGTYTLKLRAIYGSNQRSDTLTVDVLPPAPDRLVSARSNRGRDFWLMFLPNTEMANEVPYIGCDLVVNAEVDTAVRVDYSLDDGAHELHADVPARGSTNLTLWNYPPGDFDPSDTILSNGVHLVADHPVTVHGLDYEQVSTDGYLALPTSLLGTNYIVLSYRNSPAWFDTNSVVGGTEFGVVSPQDETHVTITPAVTTGARCGGDPYEIVLQRGETYRLANIDGPDADLTGTSITSDNPVAVFGGHRAALVPAGCPSADHLVEQLPPVSAWGREFVTLPLAARAGGDTIRILSQSNATRISIDGKLRTTLDRGQYYETILGSPAQILASQPILVAQFANGTGYDGGLGDPFMMLVPSFEQFGGEYTISTAPPIWNFWDREFEDLYTNYLSLVVRTNGVGSIVLDGDALSAGRFQTVSNTGYAGAQIPVVPGVHHLSAPVPFSVCVYGWAFCESYALAGGINSETVDDGTTLELEQPTPFAALGREKFVTATVRNKRGLPLIDVSVDFQAAGANSAAAHVTTSRFGEAIFSYSGTNAGPDVITASLADLRESITNTWRSQDENAAPIVSTSATEPQQFGLTARLEGSVLDDSRPPGAHLGARWRLLDGPAGAEIDHAADLITSAVCEEPGTYLFELAADDTQFSTRSVARVALVRPFTVDLYGPEPGACYASNSCFSFWVNVNLVEGVFTNVDFFDGDTKISDDNSTCLSLDGLPPGDHSITAVVTEDHGFQVRSEPLRFSVTAPPVIEAILPDHDLVLPYGACTATFRARASDPDGTITNLAVYVGPTLIWQVPGDSIDFTGPADAGEPFYGKYDVQPVRWVATDDRGISSEISPVSINLLPPEITTLIMCPQENQVFVAGQQVNFLAEASVPAPARIQGVRFFRRIGGRWQWLDPSDDTVPPYTSSWMAQDPGDYEFSLMAETDLGTSTWAASRHIHVVSPPVPNVILGLVPENQTNAQVGFPVLVVPQISMTNPVTIARVEFIADGQPWAETTNAPFLCPYLATNPGPHVLTARVTTEFGTQASSPPLEIDFSLSLQALWEGVRDGEWVPIGTNKTLGIRLVDPGSVFDHAEFLANGVTLTNTPFTFLDWTPAAPGDYTLCVRAYDRFGNGHESERIAVHAAWLHIPEVRFVTPSQLGHFAAGEPVVFEISAVDPDSGITNLSLFHHSNLEASSANGSLSYAQTNLTPGRYEFNAVATNDKGLAGQARIRIVVDAPVNPALAPPSRLDARPFGCNAIRISWDTNSENAGGLVVIERAEGTNEIWELAGKLPLERGVLENHFLRAATLYRFRAYTQDHDGQRSIDSSILSSRTREYLPGYAALDVAEGLDDAGAFAAANPNPGPPGARIPQSASVRMASLDSDAGAGVIPLDAFFTLGISDFNSVLVAGGLTNYVWSPIGGYQALADTNFFPFRMARCGAAVGTRYVEAPLGPRGFVAQYHAALWAEDYADLTPNPELLRSPPDLPPLSTPYAVTNTIADMNSSGDAVGVASWVWVGSDDGLSSWLALGPSKRATLWSGNTHAPTEFGTLQQIGNESEFQAINDSGEIVGVSSLIDLERLGAQVTHAVRSRVSLASSLDPKLTDLGTLGGLYSAATAINNSGIAAGYSTESPEDSITNTRAVFWLPTDTRPRELPGFGTNLFSDSHGINDQNQIVGEAVDSSGAQQAVLWKPNWTADGGFGCDTVNLNDLTHNLDWQLYSASAINGSGLITGSGYHLTEIVLPDGSRQFATIPRAFLLLPGTSLAVDYNRDGRIELSDKDDLPDQQPYQFWVNDDSDNSSLDRLLGISDLPGAQSGFSELDGRDPDWDDNEVNGAADLVDWFPVYLNITNLLALFPASQYEYRLVQRDDALNFLYTALRPEEAGSYLTRSLTSGFGPEFDQPAATAPGVQQVTAGGVALSAEFLDRVAAGNGGVLLFEARRPTAEPLRLEVRSSRRIVAALELPLQISGAEAMYGWANIRPVAGEMPERDTDLAPANPAAFARPDEAFVFVHGYNVNERQSRAWAAEMFKRLWWSGSTRAFYGVSWRGDDSQVAGQTTINYHINVRHAFESSGTMAFFLTNLLADRDVTVAAHSLGNMVVCSAIQDHGARPDRYYMVNGAVAVEAFDETLPDEPFMTHPDWSAYPKRLHASEWHSLFPQSDGRRGLTWRGRFQDVPRLTQLYNFYSSGEEVLENRKDNSDPWVTDILSLQFQLPAFRSPLNWLEGRFAWGLQEMLKGRVTEADIARLYSAGYLVGGIPVCLGLRLADVRVGNLMGSQYGGWGFNPYWDTSGSIVAVNTGDAGLWMYLPGGHFSPELTFAITDSELKANPFFLPFLDARLTTSEGAALASDPSVRAQLLAEAIPARTFAVGANGLPNRGAPAEGGQVNMNAECQKAGWPETRLVSERHGSRWEHSDIHDIPFLHTWMAFKKLATEDNH